MRRHATWGLPALVVLVAVGRAATAAPIPSAGPATESDRRELFTTMANEEPHMRRSAAKDFPADAWSQDDAFHNFEYKRARTLAGEHSVRLDEVLRAVDDGMRGNWSKAAGVWLNPSVPPCRPRPIH